MRLLLDTCTFLWLVSDKAKLSRQCVELFGDPQSEVYLSSISAWEIALKHKLGNLGLALPPAQFIPKYRALHGITTLSLKEEAVLELSRVPQLHKDPFDRMLICQAIAHGLAILTPDPLIGQYPVRVLW